MVLLMATRSVTSWGGVMASLKESRLEERLVREMARRLEKRLASSKESLMASRWEKSLD
jgi:hypothetical protein